MNGSKADIPMCESSSIEGKGYEKSRFKPSLSMGESDASARQFEREMLP
jgi:hypothetical protein